MSQAARETSPLQQGVLYGPVQSRRLGRSLGLNILPDEIKVCSMDCGYCQYSWTGILSMHPAQYAGFLPSRAEVAGALEKMLKRLRSAGTPPDTLTFSGNGEATLHPDFAAIAGDVVALRDAYAPACRTAILTNSTTVHRPEIRQALLLLDDPILKLDAGREETFLRLNRPAKGVTFDGIVQGLRAMGNSAILQSLFVRGAVDNSTGDEVEAWASLVASINPRQVQIYTLDRGPADLGMLPVDGERLHAIADAVAGRCGVDARLYL